MWPLWPHVLVKLNQCVINELHWVLAVCINKEMIWSCSNHKISIRIDWIWLNLLCHTNYLYKCMVCVLCRIALVLWYLIFSIFFQHFIRWRVSLFLSLSLWFSLSIFFFLSLSFSWHKSFVSDNFATIVQSQYHFTISIHKVKHGFPVFQTGKLCFSAGTLSLLANCAMQ